MHHRQTSELPPWIATNDTIDSNSSRNPASMPPVENQVASPVAGATYSPPATERRAAFPFRLPSPSAGKVETNVEEGTPPRAAPVIASHPSPSSTPTKELSASAGGGTIGRKRRREMVVMAACLAVPAAFLITYGAVASTQDFIQYLNQDGTSGGGGGGQMATATTATDGGGGADRFDGTVTAPTPSQHDRPSSNPFLAFLTGAAMSDSDADVVGLGSYLSNVVSPHAPYRPANQLPLLWTPGAPNDGFLVNKIRNCVDGVVQASYLGRTVAEEARGTTDGGYEERPLSVMGGGEGDGGRNRGRYVDVDMSTLHGLQRAKDHNLVDSGLADVVISPFLPEILDLFDSASTHHRPRLFLLLQDVKARLKASYNYLHGQNIFSGSYLEFISSNHILANDYLVRMLSGKWDVVAHPPESLTQDDLHIAVQELQTKFFVGVMRHVQPYLEHIVDLLGWQSKQPGAEDVVSCMFPTAAYDEAHPPTYPQAKPTDETELEMQMRMIIRNRNAWDMRLLEIFVQRWDDGVLAYMDM